MFIDTEHQQVVVFYSLHASVTSCGLPFLKISKTLLDLSICVQSKCTERKKLWPIIHWHNRISINFLKLLIKKQILCSCSASMARGRGVSRLWGGEVFVCNVELLWLLVWRMTRARYRSVSPWRRDNMTLHHRHQPIITIRSHSDIRQRRMFVYPGIDRVITIIHDTLRH